MTAGITSYGAYIPYHRMGRETLHNAWGGFPVPGEKAVASFDEDSITMAVEAAIDCLGNIDRGSIDGLFFATTTSPYTEKLGAATIAAALDLSSEIRTADFTNSTRAGTTAINFAIDTLKAGSAQNILVIVSETRQGGPGGHFEQALGDGAAAFLLGKKGVIAEIQEKYSISDEFSGVWRIEGDVFVRSWEDRMVLDEGYSKFLSKAMSTLMEKCNLTAADITKAIYDAPTDIRRHMRLGPKLGFAPEQIQDSMFLSIGNTGSALAPMMLVAALETAKAGDKYIFAGYGNGADAFIIEVTKSISKVRGKRGIRKHLESKRMLDNYVTYLRWRNAIPIDEARRWARDAQYPTSVSLLLRERRALLSLCGVKCRRCGTAQYDQAANSTLPLRVCAVCHARDEFDDYFFANKKGTVFSYTHDNLAASNDPPVTTAVVDFEGGGRSTFDMTDRDPEQVKVGMQVEMTFRKLYHSGGINNYFWKARPFRA